MCAMSCVEVVHPLHVRCVCWTHASEDPSDLRTHVLCCVEVDACLQNHSFTQQNTRLHGASASATYGTHSHISLARTHTHTLYLRLPFPAPIGLSIRSLAARDVITRSLARSPHAQHTQPLTAHMDTLAHPVTRDAHTHTTHKHLTHWHSHTHCVTAADSQYKNKIIV